MNYITKEQYLSLRAQWRVEYKELSDQIRAKKLEYKAAQRLDWKEGYKQVYKALAELTSLRRKAQNMLGDRAAMKELAQSSYERDKILIS